MKRTPLTPKDIPAGSCIRHASENKYWTSVLSSDDFGVFVHWRATYLHYEYLMTGDWEIYHPIVYPNWKKCYKIEHTNQGDPIIEHPDA